MTLAAPGTGWLKTILLTQDVSLDALGRGDGRATSERSPTAWRPWPFSSLRLSIGAVTVPTEFWIDCPRLPPEEEQ